MMTLSPHPLWQASRAALYNIKMVVSFVLYRHYTLTKLIYKSHHDLHISNALKRIVYTAVSHLHQNLLDGLAVVLWVHKLGGSKLLCFLELCSVDVHTNDPGCPSNLTAHNSSQANSSEAKHGTCRTRLNLSVYEGEKANLLISNWGIIVLQQQVIQACHENSKYTVNIHKD